MRDEALATGIGVLITFHVVCFGWILFRATSMKAVGEMLRQIFTNFHPEVFMQFVLGYKGVFALMVIGYVLHFMPKRSEDALRGVVTRSPLLIQAAILAIAIFIVVQFKSAGVQPFIYSNSKGTNTYIGIASRRYRCRAIPIVP